LNPVATKHFTNCLIHGRQRVDDYKMKSRVLIPEKYKVYCRKCHEYYLSDEYVPSEYDLELCINALNDMYFSCSNQQTPKYFSKYMPNFLKVINNFTVNGVIDELKFSNKIYLLKNKLFNAPICIFNNCTNYAKLLQPPGFGFSLYCEEHKDVMYSSKKENELFEYVKSIYKNKIYKNYRKIENRELDIYIPEHNLGIEFNGLFWHSEKYKNKLNHFEKNKLFKEYNINILNIWEDEWKYKKEIVKSIISNALKLNKNKLDARKCKIIEVNNINKEIFLIDNHIQGNCASSINLGLYYDNELVSVMTFGKKRMIMKGVSINKNQYELLRFCSKLHVNIRGGASKLFNYFIQYYNPQNIISYSNLSIGSGNLYNVLGFNYIGHTDIDYWWSDCDKRYHRSGFMKHKLVKLGYDKNKTEAEIMSERKYSRIWGLGNGKWEWNLNKTLT